MEDILIKLMDGEGEYISGEDLAKELGITRAAIWKKIAKLREEGYEIESVPRKGYRLLISPQNVLNVQRIKREIDLSSFGGEFIYLNEVDSTNTYLKNNSESLQSGAIVFAEKQNAGRGRFGRAWENEYGKNIQMSILLKPKIVPERAVFITLVAGAALISTFLDMGIDSKIKWPNDILVGDKKVCGILTELNLELMEINNIILGIGVNVNAEKFPESIGKKATSLLIEGHETKREDIIIGFVNNFKVLYRDYIENNKKDVVLEILNKYSFLEGKKIKVEDASGYIEGQYERIDAQGNLVIISDNGKKLSLSSGEVSLKNIY